MVEGIAAIGAGVLLGEGVVGAAVGFHQREQRTVEVAQLQVDACQPRLPLRQSQTVEEGRQLTDERQPDGQDHCGHGW
jgi:hypothetical protein